MQIVPTSRPELKNPLNRFANVVNEVIFVVYPESKLTISTMSGETGSYPGQIMYWDNERGFNPNLGKRSIQLETRLTVD